ncbi:2-hydroxy-palmitic acid dioxygenase MPO1-like [Apium graveolens]|uniref:2-hydroxy-palmitic acid dioxygenase MPO1-like n=1 Tax=Apium graveolens TaxID=4045 RepID=UPI003D7BF891
MGLFDLEKHFAFYGSYHHNPVNIFIHTIFVWPIFFTALILCYFTPPLFTSPEILFLGRPLIFNFGFLLTVIYGLFYIGLDYKAGSLGALICSGCWVFASFLASHLGFSLAWKVVLAAQIICWTAQFIGHGVFEKRAPALLDNLVQAFLMAPFFVLLEVLMLLHYEPYPGFHKAVEARIEALIQEWKDKNKKKAF